MNRNLIGYIIAGVLFIILVAAQISLNNQVASIKDNQTTTLTTVNSQGESLTQVINFLNQAIAESNATSTRK